MRRVRRNAGRPLRMRGPPPEILATPAPPGAVLSAMSSDFPRQPRGGSGPSGEPGPGGIPSIPRSVSQGRSLLDMNAYQWTVLFAAWLGWGFDVFDGLLFNYVAPNCVPALLHLAQGSPEARSATLYWAGLLSSILLIGWAAGGVLFGLVAD